MSGGPFLWHPGESVAPLADVLSRGGIVAFPTESSYGYGVDPRNPRGVEEVYRVKGRAGDKALPVVIPDLDALECLGVDSRLKAVELLSRIWPAPLTAILPTALDVPAAAGSGSLAVRIPAHEGLRSWLRELGPLTATSANPSGRPPALTRGEVESFLAGRDAGIIESPPLPGGAPSTLIRFEGDGWEVLREGAFPLSELDRLESGQA